MGISIDSASAASAASAASSSQSTASNTLSTSDFMTLMIQQLVNQDPLNPMTNQDLLNQVSQIQNVQTLQQLDTTMTGMTAQQGYATAGTLIGKTVTGTVKDNQGNTLGVTGVVQSAAISSTNGLTLTVLTNINGQNIPVQLSLSDVTGIEGTSN